MVSESGNAVGKSWPKESGSPRSRFRGTAKRGLPNRTADAVAAVPKAPVMNTIRLCGNDIDGAAISGTVPQLATLFETIVQTDSLLDRVWYAADVDPAPGQLASYGGNAVRIIGGIDRLVDLIRDRPQVDFGVFCVDPCFVQFETPQRTRLGRGPSRRRSKDSQIEVVAFDSTLIEVTTDRGAAPRPPHLRIPPPKAALREMKRAVKT